MLQLLLAFQHPDILSHELIAVIVGIDPGGDALIVLVGDLIVVEVGADVGIANDGDADRCLVVDEKGEALDGPNDVDLRTGTDEKETAER